MIPHDTHLQIGSLLFEGVDQIDLTGPFEVLSRIPNSTYRLYGKTAEPVRDLKGLRLTPDAALADAPQLDVLHVPGGFGQEALMEDAEVLGWIRAAGGRRAQRLLGLHRRAALRRGRPAARDAGRRRTGRRFICCRCSARSPSTNGWSSTATGCSPPASRPGSTARCGSPPSCAATTRRGRSSSTWCMRRSRRSTAARPRPRRPRSWTQARQSVAGITAQREATARRVAARLGIDAPAIGRAGSQRPAIWRETRVLALPPSLPSHDQTPATSRRTA